MLKNSLASLALTVSITTPSMASEQTVVFPTEFPCGTLKQISKLLKDFNEEPALTATSTREIEGKTHTIPVVFFINPKTKTWTMVEKYTKEFYCVAGLGENIFPYLPE